MKVADDAEVAVGGHDARDGDGLTDAVIGARVEDVRLAPSGECREAEEGGQEGSQEDGEEREPGVGQGK